MTPQLRPYQIRGIQAVNDRLRTGVRRILLVSPTGSGKTVVAGEVLTQAARRGIPSMFLAHRAELVEQCAEKLTRFGTAHGILMAGHKPDPRQLVQVASVPTLLARKIRPPAKLIILDEARLHRADQSARLLEAYPGAILLGLDATPVRTDGRGMGEMFDDLVLLATPRELMDEGYLVRPEGFSYDDPERDLSQVARRGGDYDPQSLARIMGRGRVLGNIVERYLQDALGTRAILFACTVSQSRELAARFRAEGISAEHVDGEMAMGVRRAILDRVREGSTLVLCNVGIGTYGLDIPALETAILARPTLSVALYLQMVGRVLRPSPETGKTEARIHDHAGCMLMHGLPEADREWTLTMDRPKAIEEARAVRVCDLCQRALPVHRVTCPHCLSAVIRDVQSPESSEDEGRVVQMAELRDIDPATQRRGFLEIVSTAQASGMKPGWAAVEFKRRFGVWPNWHWLQSE